MQEFIGETKEIPYSFPGNQSASEIRGSSFEIRIAISMILFVIYENDHGFSPFSQKLFFILECNKLLIVAKNILYIALISSVFVMQPFVGQIYILTKKNYISFLTMRHTG